MVATIGSYISFAGALVFLLVIWKTFTSGEKVSDNYWGEGANTLEWSVSSPPAFHSHATIPRID